jgi:chemotaxis response regulator CheB
MATNTLPFSQPQKVVRAVRNAISSRRPRVVVADDSTVAREGVAAIIRQDLRCSLCGLASDPQGLNGLLEQQQPDLLLIEPFISNYDGIFLLKLLQEDTCTAAIVYRERKE